MSSSDHSQESMASAMTVQESIPSPDAVQEADVPSLSSAEQEEALTHLSLVTACSKLIEDICAGRDIPSTPESEGIQEILEQAKESLEQEDVDGTFHKFFYLLSSLFSSRESADDQTNTFMKVADKLPISDQTTIQSLQEAGEFVEKKIAELHDIKHSLYSTAVLSRIKNQIYQRKQSNETLASDPVKQCLAQCKPGQILLCNKHKDTSIGATLLRKYDSTNPADYTHSMLLTERNGELMAVHATQNKESGEGGGVEEIPLEFYLRKHSPMDLLLLDQEEEQAQESVRFAREQVGKGYDYFAAISGGIGWRFGTDKNDTYNCVELIAQSYSQDSISSLTHPNELLSSGVFTPSYMGCL